MINLKVVTPDKVVIDETIDNVSIPTTTGVITILDRHIPLVSTIKLGEMIIRKGNIETSFAVYKGLVNVKHIDVGHTEVVVLLEQAESIEDLDELRAGRALKRAHELDLEEDNIEDFNVFEGLIQKELNSVKIARKYRGRL